MAAWVSNRSELTTWTPEILARCAVCPIVRGGEVAAFVWLAEITPGVWDMHVVADERWYGKWLTPRVYKSLWCLPQELEADYFTIQLKERVTARFAEHLGFTAFPQYGIAVKDTRKLHG